MRVRPENCEMKESDKQSEARRWRIIRVRQPLAARRETSMLSGSEGFGNVMKVLVTLHCH